MIIFVIIFRTSELHLNEQNCALLIQVLSLLELIYEDRKTERQKSNKGRKEERRTEGNGVKERKEN